MDRATNRLSRARWGTLRAVMNSVRDESGAFVFELEGHFDASAAAALRRSLDAVAEEAPDATVVLDFSRVTAFRDLAIAVLARGLRAQSLRVRGLASHHERVFGCFGISASTARSSFGDRDELDARHA